jgi:hypothetical protein
LACCQRGGDAAEHMLGLLLAEWRYKGAKGHAHQFLDPKILIRTLTSGGHERSCKMGDEIHGLLQGVS